MAPLKNKISIVTGGSRGIGSSIVEKLASEGSNVAFTYLNSPEKAEELVTRLAHYGVSIKAYQSDASNHQAAKDFVAKVIEEQWDQVLTVNLKSAFNLTKFAVGHMMRQRTGSIINITSVVGVFGNAGQSNYAASKAGMIGFTKSIAKEVASRNIRCNAIAPGFIETEMTHVLDEKTKETFLKNIPLGRLAKAEEVADVVVFLASNQSSYMTGQVLSVCGGLNI